MPTFPPIHHVALTVSNLEKSTAWYNRVFETEPALEMSLDQLDRRIYLLPGGQLLGITRHKNADAAGVFDPTTAGLDHLGFSCDDRAEIDGWATYLTEHGVAHRGVQDTPYGQVLSFKDPDGNAFDFFLAGS